MTNPARWWWDRQRRPGYAVLWYLMAIGAFFVWRWPVALWAVGGLCLFGGAIGDVISSQVDPDWYKKLGD